MSHDEASRPPRSGPWGPRPTGPWGRPPSHREPAILIPPVALAILAVISAAWVLQLLVPARTGLTLQILLALSVDRAHWAALDPFGRPGLLTATSLLTHAVLHADWEHFLMNMGFGIAFMGAVERRLGGRRLALVMILAAIVGGLAFLAINWHHSAYLVGASGAVYGAIGALCRALLSDHDPGHRRMAMGLAGFLVVSNLLIALAGPALLQATLGAVIAWEAHLAGFAVGFLLGRPGRTARVLLP